MERTAYRWNIQDKIDCPRLVEVAVGDVLPEKVGERALAVPRCRGPLIREDIRSIRGRRKVNVHS